MKSLEQNHNCISLVGLVGNAACGKDTVGETFVEFGYIHQSASDILREVIHSRRLVPSRALQTEIANEVRQTEGDGYFIAQAIDRAKSHAAYSGRIAISGIYAPGEGVYIKESGGYLIGIGGNADNTLMHRYGRILKRSSGPRDALTYSEFVAAHERENQGEQTFEANVGSLMRMSDFVVDSWSDKAQVKAAVEAIVERINHGKI